MKKTLVGWVGLAIVVTAAPAFAAEGSEGGSQAAAAGFADLGLRLAEGGAAVSCEVAAIVFLISQSEEPLRGGGGGVSGNTVRVGFGVGFGVLGGLIALGGPLLNAFVVKTIGEGHPYHHPFGALAALSYASCIAVDVLAVALLFANVAVGSIVAYGLGSIAGAISMGVLQNATKDLQYQPPGWEGLETAETTRLPPGPTRFTLASF
jgi:hypothetical protein